MYFKCHGKDENKKKRQEANGTIESNVNYKQKLRQAALSKTNKAASQRSKIKGTSTLEKNRDLNNTHTHSRFIPNGVYTFFSNTKYGTYP